MVYSDQKNFPKALEYKQKAYDAFLQTGDTAQIANALTRLGNVYWSMKQIDKALKNYYQALEMFEKINHKRGIAIVYNNIAGIYDEQGEHKKSLEIYLKALVLRESIGDKNGIVILLNNIGNVYVNLQKYTDAIDAFNKSIKIANDIGYKDMLRENYKNISMLYASMNDYRKAFDFHTKFFTMHDSIFNENSLQSINDLQSKYEIEKRENKIALLSKDNEIREAELSKNRLFRNALIGGIGIVILLLYILFNRYRLKQKTNKELEEKNKTIEIAYTIIEEKNKDITDSILYARRLQQAILPPMEMIKKHLPDSFVLYKPKDIVAGDFYWMHCSQDSGVRSSETGHPASSGMSQPVRLHKTHNSELVSELRTPYSELILFAACDCTGHGVPGAFVSIVAHNALNSAVKESGLTKPSAILDKVNELVEETFSKSESEIKDGMDIALCRLSIANSQWSLEYAGANNSIYFIRNGKLNEIKADVQPIGKYSKRIPFTNHEMELQNGDAIYAFSDGYPDQFGGPKGKKFKYSQFEKLLLSIQEKSMIEQREILNNEIEKWRGELEQIDDICIIGVRI